MIETELGKQLREHYKGLARFTRIESHVVGTGIPDYHVQERRHGYGWWVELKTITPADERKSGKIIIPWRPGQRNWMKEHASYGGNCAVIIERYGKIYIIRKTHLMSAEFETPEHMMSYSYVSCPIRDLPLGLWAEM